jgi:hypothetical protein
LGSADVVAFESTARQRVDELIAKGIDSEGLRALLKELEDSSLPGFEVSRRSARLASFLPPAASPPLAVAAAESSREIRSAIVGILPPDYQQEAYRPWPATSPLVPAPATVMEPQPTDLTTGVLEAEEEDEADRWHGVLLLGTAQESAANTRLLENRGIKAVRVSTLEAFEKAGDDGICGLIIYASWWNQFDGADAIVQFSRTRIARSNLLYTKIEFNNLGEAEVPLGELIQGLDDEVKARVNCSAEAGLTALDLQALEATATSLRAAWRVRVGVEGIGIADRQLLAAAIAAFGRAKHLPRSRDPEQLSIRPIHEGRSGADVLAVRSEAYQLIVVAKLDELPALEAELDRARRTMPARWLTAGELCLYSLGGRGVLLQRLLGDLDSPEQGAPSLRDRLRDCAAWENGRQGIPEPDLSELNQGLDRLVEKVIELNRTAGDEPASRGWMDAKPLQRLAEFDVRWQVGEAGNEFDPTEHLNRAKEILEAHEGRKVIHGDLHAGNTLMPDIRTPDLIDFAMAGSGHPCFDLVRISSAVAYGFLRQLVGETQFRAFFERLHIGGGTEPELKAEFPGLLTGIGGQVALHALVICRAAALEAAGGEADEALSQYLAMVYLIAAQSLIIEDLQEGIVRSALAAIGPAL